MTPKWKQYYLLNVINLRLQSMTKKTVFFTLAFCGQLALSTECFAYVGPSLGAGAAGVIIGLILAITIACISIVYIPLKRFVKWCRSKVNKSEVDSKNPK